MSSSSLNCNSEHIKLLMCNLDPAEHYQHYQQWRTNSPSNNIPMLRQIILLI